MSLREALVGYANWLGYRRGERADAWIARLELNRPEIEAFRAAATPAAAAYLPCATVVQTAEGVAAGDARLPADAPAALERARAHANLNAFTWLAEKAEGHGEGLLAGVPVVVKDLMAVRGAPLSGGTLSLDRTFAATDAEVVARLRKAGAVVIGLTNLHELAYGVTSDNPHFGRVVNPRSPSRIPGGSSGGTAAAIAAGIVRLGTGTDTSGSIRIPAACCGIVGLKPSYDAIPREGVLDLAWSLDHVGPMAAGVDECARLFAAMLGLADEPGWKQRDVSFMTIAKLGGYFAEPLDPEVRAAVEEAAGALSAEGATLVDQAIDGMALAPAIQLNTIAAEAAAYHAERLRDRGHQMGEDVRVRLESGLFFPAHWYIKAQRLRGELVARMDVLLQEADALLCATLRTPAPPIGAARIDIGGRDYPLHTAVTNLTLPFNFAGLPAVSIPWTMSSDGVPIALQVVCARGRDWRALAIAERLEQRSPWRARR